MAYFFVAYFLFSAFIIAQNIPQKIKKYLAPKKERGILILV